jgi:sec-independent protein translocase protein TatA
MGSFGPLHWLLVAVVVLLLFGGRGKLSGIMGDAAKGIKAFKEGLKDEDKPEDKPASPPPAAAPLPRAEEAARQEDKHTA